MSIGYAAIGSVSLDIEGNITAKAQNGVFISNVTCVDNDLTLSNNVNFALNNYVASDTMINHNITLADTNISSSKITYDIDIVNNNKFAVMLFEIVNEKNVPNGANNNDNIIFELKRKNKNGQYVELEINDSISPNETMNIRITFSYSATADTSQDNFSNKLNSYISFNFNSSEAVYDLTGDYQLYKAPATGLYKIELWGAQGGGGSVGSTGITYEGGTGGYVSGEIKLAKNDMLYLYVGGKGQSYFENNDTERYTGGYNGGGDGFRYAYAGGGATDIRYFGSYQPTLDDLKWDSPLGLKSRILVAAGGGGSSTDYNKSGGAFSLGGSAGGLIGYNSIPGQYTYPVKGIGATQFKGSSFGKGFNTPSEPTTSYAGGGGGYYGSAKSLGDVVWNKAAGGGSSFISGHAGSVAILSNSSLSTRNDSSGNLCSSTSSTGYRADGYNIDYTCSIHYSGKIFENTKMIDGVGYSWTIINDELSKTLEQMPNPIGGLYNSNIGHSGDGYAKITLISVD